MDVKNAFLNGDLSEEVYMQPLSGLSVESSKVCHLQCAIYGLKQAPRAWFAKFSSTIFRLVTLLVRMILPYFFVVLIKAPFCFFYMWMI